MATTPVLNRIKLLNFTIVVEAIFLLLATAWSYLAGLQLADVFAMHVFPVLLGLGAGLVMAGSNCMLMSLSRRLSWLKQLRDIMDRLLLPMVSELKPLDMVIIAILTGFCEEVFFRGVAQRQCGLVITSIAFGLFHDPSFSNVTYSFLAFLYGLVLGYLYMVTGNIWTPVLAHATHNLITLLVLRYWVKPPASPVGQP